MRASLDLDRLYREHAQGLFAFLLNFTRHEADTRDVLQEVFVKLAFGLFGLVTLVALAFAIENWRGRQAWEQFRQEWEAKGEHFDLASFIPKPVPPEQNFALTPFLAPLLDYEFVGGTVRWRDSNGVARAKSVCLGGKENYPGPFPSQGSWQRGESCDWKAWQTFYRDNTNFHLPTPSGEPAADVLAALKKYDPVFAELRTACQRPAAVYPIHYDETFFALLPQLSVLKSLTSLLALRASANLAAGHSDDALADLQLALCLSQSLRSEPLLLSQSVRTALTQRLLQPVWEGLAQGKWTAAHLEQLQGALAAIDLLEAYGQAMRAERAFCHEIMEQWRSGRVPAVTAAELAPGSKPPLWLLPCGWLYQNELRIDQLHQQFTLPAANAAQHRVYPEKWDTNIVASQLGSVSPYNFFARMLFPALHKTVASFAQAQASLDCAVLACALERHRIETGTYPKSLEALVPRHVAKLPPDLITGKPLNYRLDDAGRPVLYSVGWNGKDDGGTVALTPTKPPRVDREKGDWVWRFPIR